MEVRERGGELAAEGDGLVDGEAAFLGEQAAQAAALHQLHGQEQQPVRLVEVVDADHVGVRLAGRLDLAAQALAGRLLHEVRQDDLDRDLLPEPFVERRVHHPRGATAEHLTEHEPAGKHLTRRR